MANREPVNILIVDDLPDKLLALQAVLEELGENIITANSGREALRRLLENDFAVILLDYNMPEMDGFETAALIRQHKRCAHTPIIFVTAFADELLAAKGYSLGAVDYILSPVVPSILRAKVTVFIDLFRKSEQIKKQAEQLRQLEKLENEARNAAILNTALDCIITFDENGRIVEFNPAAEYLFHCRSARALGKKIEEFIDFSSPADELHSPVRSSANFGALVGKRFEAQASDTIGLHFPVEIAIAPVSWEGTRYFTAFVRDIAESKNIERRRNTRLEVAQVIADAEDLTDAIRRILEVVCRNLDWDLGAYWQLENDQPPTLACTQFWHPESQVLNIFQSQSSTIRFKKGEGLPGRTLESGRSEWIVDFSKDGNFPRREIAEKAGLQSAFAFPIRTATEFLGCMEFFSFHHRKQDADLLELMATIGSQIGQYSDRKSAEDRLRKNEQELSDLFENASYGLHWSAPDGTILRANPAELEILQIPREEYIGRNIAEFHVDPNAVTQIFESVRRGEALRNFPAQLRRKQGDIRHVIINTNGFWVDGKLVQLHSFTQDVTDELRLKELQLRLAAIVESSEDAIVSKSLDGIIQSWNRGAERLFGYKSNEIVGQSILTIIPPDRIEEQQSIIERLRSGERIEHFETLRIAKDKRRIHISLSVSPIRDMNGVVIGASKVARDITSRKRDEDARRRQEKHVELLNEAASHLLMAGSSDRIMQTLFERIHEHLGLSAYFNYLVDEGQETLTLASHFGLKDEELRPWKTVAFGKQVTGTVAREKRTHIYHDIQSSDDPLLQSARNFGFRSVVCNPLMTGNNLLGTLTFASRTKDRFDEDELEFLGALSHYVAAAFERLQLIGKLREADRRKDEFLATLAHELRNPLAPIRNALHILKQKNVDAGTQHQMREIAERQIQHMARLLEDLMDVSRISRGMVSLRNQQVDLTALAGRAAELIRPSIQESRHQLTMELPSHPVFVYGDLTRLEQILMNLLNNACRYTNPGGAISVTLKEQDGKALFRVKDNGIGISAEMIPHVFDLFVQAERRLERSRGGIGIGLTLVRRLVELHGGTITANSSGIGQGSEFDVTMPLMKETSPEAAPQEVFASELRKKNAQRVLVVDDNIDAAESLAALLRIEGQDVRTAYDGAAALEVAEQHHPTVVFLDIGMPKLNGYQVCREMRQRKETETALIVALTGWGQEADRMKSNESGFDWHLVKPVEMNMLQKLLELASAKSRI